MLNTSKYKIYAIGSATDVYPKQGFRKTLIIHINSKQIQKKAPKTGLVTEFHKVFIALSKESHRMSKIEH